MTHILDHRTAALPDALIVCETQAEPVRVCARCGAESTLLDADDLCPACAEIRYCLGCGASGYLHGDGLCALCSDLDEQLDAYMTMALHIVQRMKQMDGETV